MHKALTGLRPYTAGDIVKLSRLLTEARAWPPPAPPNPDDLRLRWSRWHVEPERDITILPGTNGELLAYSRTTLMTEPTPRVSLEIAVHPQRRNLGIGSALYDLAEERAGTLQVPHLTSSVYVSPDLDCSHSIRFLESHGFFSDRRFWQLRLDNISSQPAPNLPSGFDFRPFNSTWEDAERWSELIHAVFNEPANPGRVMAQLEEPGCDPACYIFVVDRATGQEVGTSRARIDVIGGRDTGYVGTVGVLPRYRRRGLARALVLQTLRYLSSRGMESAVLFVEESNHNARRLYETMGWQPVYQTIHFWKHLTYPREAGTC